VTQLLNRGDGQPFDLGDEEKFAHFAESLGVILDTLRRVSSSDYWVAARIDRALIGSPPKIPINNTL
jgi:hypothetical protein